MGNKDSKIALIANNRDICRIIPANNEKGKYDFKIDLFGAKFELNMFKIFANEPITYRSEETENFEITYHRIKEDKPAIIHLKKIRALKENELQYKTLPLKNIISPGSKQLFPSPFMKIELPPEGKFKEYKQKKYHSVIDAKRNNVIELYLINKDFDYERFATKFPAIHLAYTMLSFEYFATNSLLTDNQKMMSLTIPPEGVEISNIVPINNDLFILANYFRDEKLFNSKSQQLKISFIENSLSEAIVAMTKVKYQNSANPYFYENIYLGAASLKDINQPLFPVVNPSLGEDTLIQDSISRNNLSTAEEHDIYKRGVQLRRDLLSAMRKQG